MSDGPSQSPPTAAELERQKWLHEQNQRAAERAHDTSKEVALRVNDAAISAGNLARRMSLLINGGAAAALLTFVGGLPANQKRAVADTLVWFASGVAAAAVGLGLAYLTNYTMVMMQGSKMWHNQPPYVVDGPTTARWKRLNMVFHIAALLAGLASLVLFIVGMLSVRAALTKLA
jgi:hypothetical protein